jgi:hypothetical protein
MTLSCIDTASVGVAVESRIARKEGIAAKLDTIAYRKRDSFTKAPNYISTPANFEVVSYNDFQLQCAA